MFYFTCEKISHMCHHDGVIQVPPPSQLWFSAAAAFAGLGRRAMLPASRMAIKMAARHRARYS
jgi:hypothetical protein